MAMEAAAETGIVTDQEDSDVSLLIVSDGDENIAGSTNDSVNLRIADAVLSDGTASNAGLEVGADESCPVSVATTEDAVVTGNDIRCPRRRRRSHHRRPRSGRRRHRLCHFKRKESNYVSATCHVIVIVLVCIALAESRWIYIQGGRCSNAHHATVNYLGVKTFFYEGSSDSAVVNHNAYFYGNSAHDVLLDCVTSDTVLIMRVIISLSFIVIILSLSACLMDVLGPTHLVCRAIRLTASFSILSACCCVVITGLCYLLTQQLTNYYSTTRLHKTSKVLVQFNIGFYIMTSAGGVAIIGVACTLMKRSIRVPSSQRRCVSSDRWQADADLERLAEMASTVRPPAGRTAPPYQR